MNANTRTFLLCLALAIPTAAQSVTVGSQGVLSGTTSFNATPPYTIVDLSHPATTDGTLTSASVGWLFTSCTGAFKIKFLRPSSTNTLASYTLVAERGPFTAQAGRNQLSLTPPVSVKQGDLIAVTSLVSKATCGCPRGSTQTNAAIMQLTGDVSSGTLNGAYIRGFTLAARATDTSNVLEGVIPAVGSAAGAFGSFFRTALQIACPGGGTCTGQLVFHPAGGPSSPSDQAIPYTVGETAVSYTDLVTTMGKSGLGTLDVVSNNGFPPLVTARVYNDQGANGTSGFTEEMIRPADVIHSGDAAVLMTPADLTHFRANIGIRTLSSDVTIDAQYGQRTTSERLVPANTFQQFSLTDFGDATPVENEQIFLFVSGDVVIYESVTDNKTNDSSISFARRQ